MYIYLLTNYLIKNNTKEMHPLKEYGPEALICKTIFL